MLSVIGSLEKMRPMGKERKIKLNRGRKAGQSPYAVKAIRLPKWVKIGEGRYFVKEI